ncbi:MAG: DNA repair protein RecO [Eubacteriales bacterium]|nr:DNA repair protein RecO [Eubacteriales bacterium]
MAEYTECEAVVLRRADYRESSRMVTLFARSHGRISAAAKGAMRPKSTLKAATELFFQGSFLLSQSRGRYVIASAQARKPHLELSADLEKLACAVYLRDFCEAVLTEGEAQDELYELLCVCLDALCREESDPRSVRLFFEVRAMELLGFQPEMAACAECGGSLEGEAWLSAAAGGLVCPRCLEKLGDGKLLLGGTVAMLRRMQTWDAARLSVLRSHETIERNLAQAWTPYLAYYLERNFRLEGFLDKLSAFAAKTESSVGRSVENRGELPCKSTKNGI